MELLITLAIMLAVMGIAIPSYRTFLARNRVKTAIRNIMTMSKSVDVMANVCRGFPMRTSEPDTDSDYGDIESFRAIVDSKECQGNIDPNSDGAVIFPRQQVCTSFSMGTDIMQGDATKSSGLCGSTCDFGDSACYRELGHGFLSSFTTVAGEGCSPDFGQPSGSEFPGAYKPGWNYNLLYDGYPGSILDAVNRPVVVLCGMARGIHPVKIVVNKAGFFSGSATVPGAQPGSVSEGIGVYDIDGSALESPCPCGPWCGDGDKKGCCSPCTDITGAYNKGIGYKF